MTVEKFWGLPGSGKTTRALEKVVEYFENGLPFSEMCICTFRRPMAQALQERLREFGVESKDMRWVATIHAVCYRLLDDAGKVVTEKNRKEFCELERIEFKPDPGWDLDGYVIETRAKDMGHALFEVYSWLRSTNTPVEDWRKCDQESISLIRAPGSWIPQFIRRWEEYKDKHELLDFADILQLVWERELVPPVRVLVIDEFQDLTRIQFEIFKMWVSRGYFDEVLIAGDKFQSIYSFFGGNPEFYDQVEGRETILKRSHRVPAKIWSAAEDILKIAGYSVPDLETTGEGIVDVVGPDYYKRLIKGYQTDCFHLVRCNYQARDVGSLLESEGIPYLGLGGWTPKMIDLYNCVLDLRKMKQDNSLTIRNSDLLMLLDIYPRLFWAGNMKWLKEIVSKATGPISYDRVNELISAGGGFWDEVCGEFPFKKGKRAKEHWYKRITGALSTYRVPIDPGRMVMVQTIHGSKGSEREVVFLHSGITKKIYRSMTSSRSGMEEEARVFFVGATRARQSLYVVHNTSEKWSYSPLIVACGL